MVGQPKSSLKMVLRDLAKRKRKHCNVFRKICFKKSFVFNRISEYGRQKLTSMYASLYENVYNEMRFCIPSTLIRLKAELFENGALENGAF